MPFSSTYNEDPVAEQPIVVNAVDTKLLVAAIRRLEDRMISSQSVFDSIAATLLMLLYPDRKFYNPTTGKWHAATISIQLDAAGGSTPIIDIEPDGVDNSLGWVRALRDPSTGLYHEVTVSLQAGAAGGLTPELDIAPSGTAEPPS